VVRPTSLSSSEASSPIPSHSIDQLDKPDTPSIPEAYTYLFGVQSLFSFCDGPAGYVIPLYNTFAVQSRSTPGSPGPEPVRALARSTRRLPESEPDRVGLQTVRAMVNAGSR